VPAEDVTGIGTNQRSLGQLEGGIKQQCNLTEDDLTRIEGKLAGLIGCLQERFGDKRDRAEQEVRTGEREA
jgi:uncharacterized protein YjbJ (UPF0337 family)